MAHPSEIVGAPRWMVSNKFHRERFVIPKYDIEIKKKKKKKLLKSNFSNGLIHNVQRNIHRKW